VVSVWFVRHGAVASHRGDVALTERGARDAEAAGERLATVLESGAAVELLHAPTRRALETAEAIRRGVARAVPSTAGIRVANPRSEHAIRNPDLYVAGIRVEMVTSIQALSAQLPPGLLTTDAVAKNEFFARFCAAQDPMRVWLDDDDPPGERPCDVARRFFAYARSLTDLVAEHPRHYVCVTHSGPMRAILAEYVTPEDPGEPQYVEAVQLRFDRGRLPAWRFR
jgi:broad specificity phosphatase PhoE